MKLKMIAACAAMLVGQSAFALGDVTNNGGHGGGGGTAIAAPVANGGTGIGVGLGGNAAAGVIGSGNSSNLNTNLQGQQQGQMQGQVATGGNATSGSSSGASATSGGNTLTGGANTATQANQTTVHGDTVTYQAQERNPVSTAYAPSIAPTAACAIGTSVGAQGASFGLSFGTSNIDANCQLLEQIRSAASVLGDRATAAEMMCEVPAYKAARERLGKPCGTLTTAKAAPVAAPQATAKPVAARAGCDYTGTDPFILARRCR